MATPHDIWEFGWTRKYDDRHAYIQSLPEGEQIWATMLFHYIDIAFGYGVRSEMGEYDWDGFDRQDGIDRAEQIREHVKDILEPPTDDRWKTRFLPGGYQDFYDRKDDE